MLLSEPLFSINRRACDSAKTDMKWMSIVLNANSCVAQLIDANLDRAREGLRVIEDWCRFGLNRKDLVVTLKDWRHQLGAHHHEIYKKARATKKDPGIGLNHSSQENRHSAEQIIAANCSRVQEALRVLEEFTRSIDPELAACASKIRYELYELESTILTSTIKSHRFQKLQYCNLCLITSPQRELSKTVAKALEAGIRMVQYRCKNGSDFERIIEAQELASLCKKHEALFIVNDRIDLALAVDADGVHLGQDDMPTRIARNLLGTEKLIGRSTHCSKQIQAAEDEGCDYLGVGPVYPTRTKPQDKPSGITYVNEASKASKLPWFAIGGINCSNLSEVLSAGAKRVALSEAIMHTNNTAKTILELLEQMP